MASSIVHNAATTGFQNAQAYDTHRPSYPPEAVESLLSHLGVSGKAGAKIVDLAAGTGKFTEALAARGEGFDVVAVEPLESMRGELVAKGLAGVEVREGTAEAFGGVGGWADGIVAAQAFHWFATEDALREISRTLKPGGKFGAIWNIEDYNQPKSWQPTTTWLADLKDLIHALKRDGAPRFRDGVWTDVFDRQAKSDEPLVSTPIGQEKTLWTVWRTAEELWDRINTLSQVAVLGGQDREAFRARFDEILRGGDVEVNEKGEVALHGVTFFAWTSRL